MMKLPSTVQLPVCMQDLFSHPTGRKVQMSVFPILIYEFNVYLFFKTGGALVGMNMVDRLFGCKRFYFLFIAFSHVGVSRHTGTQ